MADSKITALASIGTGTDPANDPLVIVDVSDVSPGGMSATGTTKKVTLNNLLSSSPTATGAFSVTGLVTAGSATITGDLTVDTSTLKVDSTNNRVGIGTASPAAALDVQGSSLRLQLQSSSNGAYSTWKYIGKNSSGTAVNFEQGLNIAADNAFELYDNQNTQLVSRYISGVSGYHSWFLSGTTAMTLNSTGLGVGGVPSGVNRFAVFNGATQALTLDTSGNLLVGTTSALASGSTIQNLGASRQVLTLKGDAFGSYTAGIWNASTINDGLFVYFGTEAALAVRGGISYNRGGGLVAYNTTSDYRAKDIIGPVSNSGSLIDSLKVYVGKMKGATIERPMLIAHEAQEVAPYAVTGTKDEVDADGNPKYQQMDVSALVPVLIAEIQSLRARVQTLEAK